MADKKNSAKDLLARAKKGDVYAASRLMSLVVRDDKKAKKLVSKLPGLSKSVLLIGVTGSGGTGKSTLIGKIILAFRKEGKTIGVIACDPLSISGGAVLGDRIRMQGDTADQEVFIRSLAQYENYKGATPETSELIKIFGMMKKDVIIVETVGVGQSDLGFKDLVKILIWVTSPGLGDEIQLLKGGAIETADIIVVNKSDKPGADLTFQELLTHFGAGKKIYKTNSVTGEGVKELVEGIKGAAQ